MTRSIREDFLHQNAFHEVDTYSSLLKQFKMLDACLFFYNQAKKALSRGVPFSEIVKMPVREKIARMKYLLESELEKIDQLKIEIEQEFKKMGREE